MSKWVKLYSEVKIDDDTVITAQQIKELQKRNAQLEEENLILKKQYSLRTQTTIDCGKSSFKSTFNHYSLQSSPCKQKHILQMPPKPPQIKTDDSNCINLLAKNFNQPAPNMVWVCDFTYIRAANRFYYLCAVLDLFARKIVSFELSIYDSIFLYM